MTESNSNEYSFDGSWEGERERLGCIESWLDADSIAALVSVGVSEGDRDRVLEKLARALKPGGALLVLETGGAPPMAFQNEEDLVRFGMGFAQAASETGWNFQWASTLGQKFSQLGLEEVRARSFRDYVRGSSQGFGGTISTSVE